MMSRSISKVIHSRMTWSCDIGNWLRMKVHTKLWGREISRDVACNLVPPSVAGECTCRTDSYDVTKDWSRERLGRRQDRELTSDCPRVQTCFRPPLISTRIPTNVSLIWEFNELIPTGESLLGKMHNNYQEKHWQHLDWVSVYSGFDWPAHQVDLGSR